MITFTYSFPSLFNSSSLTPSSGGYFAVDGIFVSSTSTLSQYLPNAALKSMGSKSMGSDSIDFAKGS